MRADLRHGCCAKAHVDSPRMHPALLLLPDFATILLGAGLRRWMHLGDPFWTGLERLVYNVMFPALLFNAITATHIDFGSAAPLLATGGILLATGILLALLARPLMPISPIAFASRFQCAFRFNSYIGIAVVGKLFGEQGIAIFGVLIGVMVPIANMFAVAALARHGRASVWRELATNPLIIATLAGLAWSLLGLPVPEPVSQFLSRLSEATIATGLLAVGAALQWRTPVRGLAMEVWFLAVKLVALPLTAWYAGRWLGLTGLYFNVAVIFASLPTASSAYILVARMGGDSAGVAWLISVGTLVAMVTMTVWVGLLL
ncbi:MAG: AEC family transporter [Gammaproteobacteria bacterium]|nr:AEC family transporter [Gammaproteobacteria bacterium]